MKTTEEHSDEKEYNKIRDKILEGIQRAREQNDSEAEISLQTQLNYIDNARLANG